MAAFDVSLMVARGHASLSFLSTAAEEIAEEAAPTFIYHLGDFDPSGVDAGRADFLSVAAALPARLGRCSGWRSRTAASACTR